MGGEGPSRPPAGPAVDGEGDDAALLAACRAGEPAAFDRLVARHERAVYRLACRILGDAEEARDAAVETFTRAYRALDRFRAEAAVSTWLHRIATNVCLSRLARARRRADVVPLDGIAEPAADAAGPLARLEARETAERVRAALDSLPADQRTILVLRELEAQSYEAIAALLDLPVGTVKSRLSRARLALRARLTETA